MKIGWKNLIFSPCLKKKLYTYTIRNLKWRLNIKKVLTVPCGIISRGVWAKKQEIFLVSSCYKEQKQNIRYIK